MSRRKPRSPGVSLRGRAAGFHRYDDEVRWDGGKTLLRRRVRRIGAHQVRQLRWADPASL